MTDNIEQKENIAAPTVDEPQTETVAAAAVEPTDVPVAAELSAKNKIDAATKRQTVVKVFVQIGLYAFLIVMAVVVLFPFYWMLISSVKSVAEYNRTVPTLWPEQFK